MFLLVTRFFSYRPGILLIIGLAVILLIGTQMEIKISGAVENAATKNNYRQLTPNEPPPISAEQSTHHSHHADLTNQTNYDIEYALRLAMLRFKERDKENLPFARVLVVVHSNFNPSLAQVNTHYDLWGHLYPSMIIFGSWTEDEHAELLKAGHPAFFLPYFHHGGAVAQEVLVRALEIFHHQRHIFTGYIYTHDDMLVSPDTLRGLDQNNLWVADGIKRQVLEPWSNRNFGWPWFNSPEFGISRMQAALGESAFIRDGILNCGDNSLHVWYFGQSDFIYIPARLRASFEQVVGAFTRQNVFIEIAVSTWVMCFAADGNRTKVQLEGQAELRFLDPNSSKVDFLPLCTDWTTESRRGNIDSWGPYCPKDTVLIHPVKLSRPNGLAFMKQFIAAHNTTGGWNNGSTSTSTAAFAS